MKNEEVSDYIFWLSKGPNPVATRYTGYFINGYRFHTKKSDARCKTQNSGVTLQALTPSFASAKDQNPIVGDVTYYRSIHEIVEIDYWGKFSVVLFRCGWFQVEKDEYGLTCVNFNKLCYSDDPFVLASQVHQVFYVEDSIKEGLHYVMKKVPADLYNLQVHNCSNIQETFWGELNDSSSDTYVVFNDDPIRWTREDAFAETLQLPTSCLEAQQTNDILEEDSDMDDSSMLGKTLMYLVNIRALSIYLLDYCLLILPDRVTCISVVEFLYNFYGHFYLN